MLEYRKKIMTWDQVRQAAEEQRRSGRTVVFTNGCFDLLHQGHVRYLADARAWGDFLIIGLNSDRSVREIKGQDRPINPEDQRAEILAGLAVVDAVVLFDQPDPYDLIALVQPKVLVKGGDWPVDKIVGRDLVEAGGGKVLSIPLVQGVSTSGIISRILSVYGS